MFGFTIIRDASFTEQAENLDLDLIESVVRAAGEIWGRYINAPDVNIDVNLSLEDFPASTLANAGPRFVNTGQGFFNVVTEQLSTGIDTGDFGVLPFEAEVTIDLQILLDGGFFITPDYVPDPAELVPPMNDLLTVLLHEWGHIFGFSILQSAETRFEENTSLINGDYFFVGQNAVAEFGGNIPLGTVNLTDGTTRIDPHFDVRGELLSAALLQGTRLPISPLEIAVLRDLGLLIAEETAGDDTLYGFEEHDDIVQGLEGGDQLFGISGNDMLLGDGASSLSLASVEGQVYRAFQAVFDRAPDLGGFNAFTGELRAGRLSQEDVISEFVTSTEFQNTYGELDNGAFIEQLYLNVLDRPGDAAGVAAFTGELNGGRSRASVVVEFANSPEFVQLMTLPSASFATNVIIHPAEGQVFRIYQAVFDREPDAAGFTAFVNSLQADVLTPEAITAEFVASEEFQLTYGELTNEAFVEALYTNVLPGNTDQAGRDAFTAALDGGTLTRAAMVAEFAESQELRNSTAEAAEAFVATVFNASSDTLDGGIGNDILFGGRGADSFVFDTEMSGQDTILDFTSGTDIIDLGSNPAFDTFAEIIAVGTQDGLDTVFDFGDGNILTLENTTLTELTEIDF